MTPWKRKEIIGGCTLYQGDAMEIMPTLDKCDLCVSDVPYKLTTGGRSKSNKTMSGIFASHNYANDGQLVMATVPFSEMMTAIYGVLKDDADCYIMSNDKNAFQLWGAALDAGFKFHNLLSWDKITPTPNRWYMKHIEFTLYLWKGAAKTINHPESKQQLRGGERNQSDHPTEKPVDLMFEYVRNSSGAGDVVIDPFMGGGTTGVACLRSGRKFVGIELDEAHFETALNRIQSAYDNPVMFSGCLKRTPEQQGALL